MTHSHRHDPVSYASTQSAPLADVPVLLLVGGLGTRLRSLVPSAPKPLATVGNSPFLALLVRQLRAQGFKRLVMCTGHLAEQVEIEFGDGTAWNMDIQYSREMEPLGTAGALRLASRHVTASPDFLVMNGDSFFEIDMGKMFEFHRRSGGIATMAVRKVPNASRYGTVQLDGAKRVVGFSEKTGRNEPGLVNAGIYVFSASLFTHIPDGRVSLEQDVFPRILEHGVYATEGSGIFIDIGTPEDYVKAQRLFTRLCEASDAGRESRSELEAG